MSLAMEDEGDLNGAGGAMTENIALEDEKDLNGAGGALTENIARTRSPTLGDYLRAPSQGEIGESGTQVGTAESGIREEKFTPAAVDVDTTRAEQPGRTHTSVILFGRTGSGKSTLAQMLTLGKLDPDSEHFASSSGVRGRTREVKHGEGRDWRVLDTPGFGEPKDQLSTISSEEAEKKIKKYLQLMEGTYTHFLYLVMRDRIDELDKRLWRFFVRLCGDTIKSNFSVVISNASQQWLEQNLENLQTTFTGCDNFLSAEFPSTKSDDPEWEAELQMIRLESLNQLEERLKMLDRNPVKCDFNDGFWKMTSRQIASSGATFKRIVKSVIDVGTTAVKSLLQYNCLIKILHVEDNQYLMPHFGAAPTASSTKPNTSNEE